MDTFPNWDIWLEKLKEKLHPDTFREHFSTIQPLGLNSDVLRVGVPFDADFSTLNQFYSSISALAWKEVTGDLIRIEFLPSEIISESNPIRPSKLQSIHSSQVNQFNNGLSSLQNNGQQGRIEQSKHRQKQPINDAALLPIKRKVIQKSFSDMPGIYLNDDYSFNSFVEGGNSEFAYAAAKAVAETPENNIYNPLLIYGGSGLGKTHLIQAIGNYYIEQYPGKTVHYITANDFKREFVSSMMKKNDSANHGKSILEEMSDYYRNEVDLLLIDDIQELSNQTETQNAFFHIFNSLHQSGKQIVLTSDCPPSGVIGLEERLISRFEWGLTVDVQLPSIETREAILKDKANRNKIDVSDEIITFIAENVDKDIRSLESVIKQLMLRTTHSRREISMDLCREALIHVNQSNAKKIHFDDVIRVIANFFEVDQEKIMAQGRGTKEVAQARQVTMYLWRDLSSESLKTIGKKIGSRDHATVVHAIRKVQETIDVDSVFVFSFENLKSKLLG